MTNSYSLSTEASKRSNKDINSFAAKAKDVDAEAAVLLDDDLLDDPAGLGVVDLADVVDSKGNNNIFDGESDGVGRDPDTAVNAIPAPVPLGPIDLLRQKRSYSWIVLGFVLCVAGDWFAEVASLSLLHLALPNSRVVVGIFLIVTVVAPVLVNPFIGPLLDRIDRMRVLLGSNILAACVTASAPLILFLTVHAPGALRATAILAMVAVRISCGDAYRVGMESVIPGLVGVENLMSANAIESLGYSGVSILASSAGGFAFNWIGATASYMIDAAMFILSAGAVTAAVRSRGPIKARSTRLSSSPSPQSSQELECIIVRGSSTSDEEGSTGERADQSCENGEDDGGKDTVTFIAGVRYIMAETTITRAVLTKALKNFMSGIFDALNVVLVAQFSWGKGGSVGLGVLFAVESLGIAAGTPVTAHLSKSSKANDPTSSGGRDFLVGILDSSVIIMAVLLVALGACTNMIAYGSVVFLLGFTEVMAYMSASTLISSAAKPEFRGRVSGLSMGLRRVAYGLGVMVAMLVPGSPRAIFSWTGATILIAGTTAWLIHVARRRFVGPRKL